MTLSRSSFLPFLRRAAAVLGAGLMCTPLFTSSCGSKSGLRTAASDAGTDSDAADAEPVQCVTNADCLPEDLCTRSECVEGFCTPPTPVVCNDNDECTEDSCKPEDGTCDFRELALDQDGDGFKGPRPGYAPGAPGSCGDDCDDTSAKAYPGGTEVCDGVDNNCNGVIDEGATYVPVGKGDILVSGNIESGRGGLSWNGELYAASYASNFSPPWRDFVKGLNPDGSTKFDAKPITNLPSDTFTGPIVWTGKIFGTAWEDRRDGDYEIYFNRLDKDGAKLGPDVRVTNAPDFSLHPAMMWNGAEFMLVWDDRRNGFDDHRIYGQRISVDGKLLGDNIQLTGPNERAELPDIVEGQKTIAIAFNSISGFGKSVGMRTLAPDFSSLGTVITVSDDQAVDPSLVFNGDRYVVAYGKRPGVAPADAIFGAVVSEDGQVLVKEKQLTVSAKFARTQSLLALGDRVLLIWADDHDGNYELYSQMLDNDLNVISPRQRITFDSHNSVAPMAVFGPEGDVGVLFEDDRLENSWQVYFTRLTCVAGVQ
jgi:hypothetical protein